MHTVSAVVGCGHALGVGLPQSFQDRVHHRGNHVARATDGGCRFGREKLALGDDDLQRPEVTIIDRVVGRKHELHGDSGCGNCAPIAPRIQWAWQLFRHIGEIHGDRVAIDNDLDLDGDCFVQINAIVV